MNKTLFFLCALMTLIGCSHKSLYQVGQNYQKSKCIAEAKTSEAHNLCLKAEREAKAYQDYEKERQSVIQK